MHAALVAITYSQHGQCCHKQVVSKQAQRAPSLPLTNGAARYALPVFVDSIPIRPTEGQTSRDGPSIICISFDHGTASSQVMQTQTKNRIGRSLKNGENLPLSCSADWIDKQLPSSAIETATVVS